VKWVKLILIGIVLVITLGAGVLATRFYVLLPLVRPAADVKAPTTAEAVARGRYLAHNVAVCMGCHSKVDEASPGEPIVEGTLGGGRIFAMADFPGTLRSANLTPDLETGLGKWTDGEILRAMREGISRDGRVLFPMMPYATYREHLSDADALAIIAYLRTLTPVKNVSPPTEVKFPVSMFVRAAPKPVDTPAPPQPAEKLARGRWLLAVGSCKDCHDTFDERRQTIAGHQLAGGYVWDVPGKGKVVTPNITSDKATGVGAYADADLRRAIFEGTGKDGRDLYIMPWTYYAEQTPEDQGALIAALREVPAVNHMVLPPAK